MQTGYCIILTLEELRSLSTATQQELAMLDADFANMMGIATPNNPPSEPKAKRTRAKKGTEQTVLPETGQLNQQSAVDPALVAAGAPQVPSNFGGPNMPQVPSGMPLSSGIPGMPQAPSPVFAPMPLPTMATPMSQNAMAQSFSGVVPPPPQPAPQPQPQQAAPQQQAAATNQVTAQQVRHVLMPQIVAQIPDSHGKIAAAVTEARTYGLLPTGDISSLTDAGVPGFLQCLRNQGLVNG